MRHLQTGRKLGVGNDHRRAMMRSMTLALIENGTIKTTAARAKELRWFADRVITLAKRGDVASRRNLIQLLGSTKTHVPGKNRVRIAIDRVYSDLAPRFSGRAGGYTQIFRLAARRAGDNAEMCIMRYLPAGESSKKDSEKPAKKAAPAAKKTKSKAASTSEKATTEKKEKAPAKAAKAKKAKAKEE